MEVWCGLFQSVNSLASRTCLPNKSFMYSIEEINHSVQYTAPVYCIMFDQYCKNEALVSDSCRKFQFVCSLERDNLDQAQHEEVESLKAKLIFILAGSIVLVFYLYRLIKYSLSKISKKDTGKSKEERSFMYIEVSKPQQPTALSNKKENKQISKIGLIY